MTLTAPSPFLPPAATPPVPRLPRPVDAVAPVSALAGLITRGSPRWAYSAVLASLIGSQRGISRLHPSMLAGHRIDSDQLLSDLVAELDRISGQSPTAEPTDAPTVLLATQALVWPVAAWSRSERLAGICRPVTRSADVFADPRLVALVELLAARPEPPQPADLLAVLGACVGDLGTDCLPRDGSMPLHRRKTARGVFRGAVVGVVAAELVARARDIHLENVERGPRRVVRPPMVWTCGEDCPMDPPPRFARQSALLLHRGHRHEHPARLGFELDSAGVWQVVDVESSPIEMAAAGLRARILR